MLRLQFCQIWNSMKRIKRKNESKEKMIRKIFVKFGFAFVILSYMLVVILFLHALTNPIHTVVIRINAFGEMIPEAIAVFLSFIAVPFFVIELVKKGVWKPFWRQKDYPVRSENDNSKR